MSDSSFGAVEYSDAIELRFDEPLNPSSTHDIYTFIQRLPVLRLCNSLV